MARLCNTTGFAGPLLLLVIATAFNTAVAFRFSGPPTGAHLGGASDTTSREIGSGHLFHSGKHQPMTWQRPQSSFAANPPSPDGDLSPNQQTQYSSTKGPLRKHQWFVTRAQEVVDTSRVKAVLLSQILLESEEMAEVVVGEVRNGRRTFLDLARELSQCNVSRDRGGRVGWIDLGHPSNAIGEETRGTLLPDLGTVRDALRMLKPGDMVKVKSKKGWHVLHVDNLDLPLTWTSTMSGSRSKKWHQSMDRPERPLAGLRYFVETMGCQMNKADSERMAGHLLGKGMIQAAGSQDADIVVVNTCAIRDQAEQKVYSHLGMHALRKRRGTLRLLAVAGCVAQQEGRQLLRRASAVDVVAGPQYVNRIADLLETAANTGAQIVATDPTLIMEDVSIPRRDSSVCAWVNIIYGCNEHCTYCVVPNTRGVEQSRPVESILHEVCRLGEEGYKEITLLGQNVDSYGRDMSPRRTFAHLLNQVAKTAATSGIERVRFVTSHPRYMSQSVVEVVASAGVLCQYFHFPFQSGDNDILKAMRRGYTIETYLRVVSRIKERIPDASISADVIVGFPGESDAAFERTLETMRNVRFDHVFSFAYSARPNTPASSFAEQLPEHVKAARLQEINKLNAEHALEQNVSKYKDRDVEVLVEAINPKNPRQVYGRTRGNRLVYFDGDISKLRGQLTQAPIRHKIIYMSVSS
eukprot:GHVT01014011.1.p1 GENE.GHVT01014011.1~~GHVT01014011.1.p1  ORF type:complete len:694 (-),score=48.00 GHVT01014011.1:985-3066(-)